PNKKVFFVEIRAPSWISIPPRENPAAAGRLHLPTDRQRRESQQNHSRTDRGMTVRPLAPST
ncbi:MAG: hypothetical protein OXF55_08530, partial [Caldilineaceae bacterium]|nr:hypothetical protein [Caldilineaceae bacterium]